MRIEFLMAKKRMEQEAAEADIVTALKTIADADTFEFSSDNAAAIGVVLEFDPEAKAKFGAADTWAG